MPNKTACQKGWVYSVVYQSSRAKSSQPAKKNRRHVKKKVWMLCMYVMYKKCVLYTVYYNVMFACTLVRSHPEGKKTLGETWAAVIKAINSILWTSVATRYTLTRMGTELSSVYAQQGTMKDVLARCLKKTSVQVCTLSCVYILFCNATLMLLLHTYLLWPTTIVSPSCTSCVYIITGIYFLQVKN